MEHAEDGTQGVSGVGRIRHAEDLANDLAELLEFAQIRTRTYRQTPGKVTTKNGDYPPVSDLLTARLQRALEDEILPATSVDDAGRIRSVELDREVMKKALMGLKGARLRDLAKNAGLTSSHSVEVLAESIANHVRWSEDAIARLVLENEDYVRPDRGFSTRIFPLREAPDLESVRANLEYVQGRYIRTGIARWFVFSEVNDLEEGEGVELNGSLRTYDASIDDRLVDSPRLSATVAGEVHSRVIIDGSDLLMVRNTPASAARSAVNATETATMVEPLYRIPFIDTSAPSIRGELHDSSKFMLDLLVNRLPAAGMGQVNITVARFKMGEESTEPWDSEGPERRANLRAVSFEGAYLLGSIQACQLLAVQQRALTDMTFHVVVKNRDRIIVGRYPVRISIDRDHVAVETSYGAGNRDLSAGVHAHVTDAVVAEINDGFGNEDRLDDFIEKIRARAGADEGVDQLDPLSDE